MEDVPAIRRRSFLADTPTSYQGIVDLAIVWLGGACGRKGARATNLN